MKKKSFGRSELVAALVAETNISDVKAKQCLDTILNSIKSALSRNQRLELRKFGVWSVRTHKAHRGRNPQTGVAVTVPAKRIVKFRLSTQVKI